MPVQADNLKTPPGISGLSAMDVFGQQKAEEELKGLLESEQPGAGAKAFAKGFAIGTSVPFVMQMLPWLTNTGARSAELANTYQRAELAHYLHKTQGVPKKEARQAAVAFGSYLNRASQHIDPGAKEIFDRAITSAGGQPPRIPAGLAAPTPQARKQVLEAAESLFENSKTKAPSAVKTYFKNFRRVAKGPAMGSAFLGGLAGLSSYSAHRARQKRLTEFRERLRGER